MNKNLLPKETAYKLWKQGKMPDSFYTANYMTPTEAMDYYRQKIMNQATQEQAIEKQIDEQIEKKVIPAI